MNRSSHDLEADGRSRIGAIRNKLRTRIITGIVVLVPLVVTFLALRLVFLWLDSLAQPLIKQITGSEDDLPGLGIVLTFVAVWVAGILGSNVVGRRLIGHGDDLIARIPLIGSIYSPVKQFIQSVASTTPTARFKRVVLAEYPSDGRWILGFVTGEIPLPDGETGRCVFVPTSPNPATGWMVIFPESRVVETELTVEDAMRLVISGGIVVPENLGKAYPVKPTNGMDVPAPAESDGSEPPAQTGPRTRHAE